LQQGFAQAEPCFCVFGKIREKTIGVPEKVLSGIEKSFWKFPGIIQRKTDVSATKTEKIKICSQCIN